MNQRNQSTADAGPQKGLCTTEDPISQSRCLQGHRCSLLPSCSLDKQQGFCQQGGSRPLPASPFHSSPKHLRSPNSSLGSFALLTLKVTKGSLLLADANWLKSSGPCGSQGPDPAERHAFDPWSQKEEQKAPNLLFSSFRTYISLSQTAWDHGFCLFIGRRRHPEQTVLN